jgi:hypothetical protein
VHSAALSFCFAPTVATAFRAVRRVLMCLAASPAELLHPLLPANRQQLLQHLAIVRQRHRFALASGKVSQRVGVSKGRQVVAPRRALQAFGCHHLGGACPLFLGCCCFSPGFCPDGSPKFTCLQAHCGIAARLSLHVHGHTWGGAGGARPILGKGSPQQTCDSWQEDILVLGQGWQGAAAKASDAALESLTQWVTRHGGRVRKARGGGSSGGAGRGLVRTVVLFVTGGLAFERTAVVGVACPLMDAPRQRLNQSALHSCAGGGPGLSRAAALMRVSELVIVGAAPHQCSLGTILINADSVGIVVIVGIVGVVGVVKKQNTD